MGEAEAAVNHEAALLSGELGPVLVASKIGGGGSGLKTKNIVNV